jgi:hypothetical protein
MKLTLRQLSKIIKEYLLTEDQEILVKKDIKGAVDLAKSESKDSDKKIAVYDTKKSTLKIFSKGKQEKLHTLGGDSVEAVKKKLNASDSQFLTLYVN